MGVEVSIRPEMAKRIAPQQELSLLRSAFACNPASQRLRAQLASLQNLNDEFGATIALLERADDLDFGETALLVQALLAQETAEANSLAREAAGRAFQLAASDRQRAAALADKGKAQVRLDDAGALASLEAALELDPHNKNACKRVAALRLGRGEARSVLEMTTALLERGVGHSRLFASRALALASLGDVAAAREVVGLDRFLTRRELGPPPGWESTPAFNRALADELAVHPGLRRDRYGSASQLSWRIETPASHGAPLSVALTQHLAAHVEHLVAEHNAHEHPWLAARPARGLLHSWCAITEDVGFEDWHVHQFGWLSGVYYVSVPDAVARGEGPGGCIAFGLPEGLAGDTGAEAFGLSLVRPGEGVALLFPSHAYHRTFPHGAGERRVCIAFDIWPERALDGAV